MFALKLVVNVSDASLKLAGRRITRALSDAIADTLKSAQVTQRRAMTTQFTIRRAQFRDLSVKITEFPRADRLTGELAIRSPGAADRSNIFGKFEAGGTKRPRSGTFIAVPIVGGPAKPTARSIVKPQWKPSALLGAGVTTPTGGRAFLRGTRGGGKVLLIEDAVGGRTKSGRLRRAKPGQPAMIGPRPLRAVFLFVKQAPIPAELDFVRTVTREIRTSWQPNFARRWADQQARATR